MLYRITIIMILGMLWSCKAKPQKKESNDRTTSSVEKIVKTDEEWKEILTDFEYYVIRDKGTERAFSGEYWDAKDEGTYVCRACELPLFAADTKFKSGTGWPSYYAPINEENVMEDVDYDLGYPRREILCARCDGHLGHVFSDGPKPTGLRYCVNSASIKLDKGEE